MNRPVVVDNIQIPRMLLIAGNGRNVGKTTLACQIIQHLAKKHPVIGVKVSAHFHPYQKADVVAGDDSFIVVEEKQINDKDSSLMLQAGAKKVYFVMSEKETLSQAINELLKLLPDQLIVCESGGLHKIAKPGLFLFVNRKKKEITKSHLLEHDPLRVENDGSDFSIDISSIIFEDQRVSIKR